MHRARSHQLVTSSSVPEHNREQSKQNKGLIEPPMARTAACRCSLLLVVILTVALVAAPSARAAWVEDYPSGVPCGATIPAEQCDPGDAAANSACMDVCHYGGCRRGGRCVSLGFARGRGCHCKC